MKPYNELTVGGQFRRFRPAALEVCKKFGVDAQRLDPLNHGENTTFRTTDTTGAKYVVRIHRIGYQTKETIQSELMFLDSLRRSTDLTAPRPLRSVDGEFIVEVFPKGLEEPRNAVMFEWVEGRFVDEKVTPKHFQMIGEATAKLHNFSETFEPSADFSRQDWGKPFAGTSLRDKVGQFADAKAFLAALDIVNDAIDGYGTARDYGLIHADLHFGNVLFRNGKAVVIDFDDLAWGHHAQDYAVSFSWHRHENGFDRLLNSYALGYEAIRPLPRDWRERFEVFLAFRTLFISDWLFTRDDNPRLREYRDSALPRWQKELARFVETGSVRER